MKTCIAAIALFAAVAVSAVESFALKYAENATVAAVEINVEQLLKHPEVEKLLNDPEKVRQRQELEKNTGVRLQDFKKVFIQINGSGDARVLLNVDKALNIEQLFARTGVKFSKLDIAGKKVLKLTDPLQTGKQVELLTLAPGMILAGETGDIAAYMKTGRGNAKELAAFAGTVPAAPVRVAFVNLFKNAQGKTDDPQKLFLTFDFAGKQQKDIAFKLNLFCGTPEGAQMLTAMVPFYLNMGLAFIFGSDPDLNREVSGCIKVKAEANVVRCTFYIPEKLGEKIGGHFEKNADKLIRQGMKASGIQAGGTAETAPDSPKTK